MKGTCSAWPRPGRTSETTPARRTSRSTSASPSSSTPSTSPARITAQPRATVIASQLPFASWCDVIGGPTQADAILDRVIHNAYKIALKGESRRKGKEDNEEP
jgi:hypothetical protein